MHSTNWDDLKFVLAVANNGSVSGAARALNVNHATVLRRISAFEKACGACIFERSAHGYQLRSDRVSVIEAAQNAKEAMEAVSRILANGADGRRDVLRLTSTDSLCQTVLSDGLSRIAERIAPDHLALLSTNHQLDMARLQADVSVRPAIELGPEMVGDKVAKMGFAVYARPQSADVWLGMCGPIAQALVAKWLAHNVPQDDLGPRADSFLVLTKMAEQGLGRAILPCVLGDNHADLVRVETDFPNIHVPLWVVCHRDLADNPRVTALRKAVVSVLRAQEAQLLGVLS